MCGEGDDCDEYCEALPALDVVGDLEMLGLPSVCESAIIAVVCNGLGAGLCCMVRMSAERADCVLGRYPSKSRGIWPLSLTLWLSNIICPVVFCTAGFDSCPYVAIDIAWASRKHLQCLQRIHPGNQSSGICASGERCESSDADNGQQSSKTKSGVAPLITAPKADKVGGSF